MTEPSEIELALAEADEVTKTFNDMGFDRSIHTQGRALEVLAHAFLEQQAEIERLKTKVQVQFDEIGHSVTHEYSQKLEAKILEYQDKAMEDRSLRISLEARIKELSDLTSMQDNGIKHLHQEIKDYLARIAELEALLSGRTISCDNCNKQASRIAELENKLATAEELLLRTQKVQHDSNCPECRKCEGDYHNDKCPIPNLKSRIAELESENQELRTIILKKAVIDDKPKGMKSDDN